MLKSVLSLHQSCLISCRRCLMSILYSEMRIFLPSTMQVRFGLGRYLLIKNCNFDSDLLSKVLPIVRVFFHMQLGQSGLLLVVGLFFGVRHPFPAGAQNFGNIRVVHVRAGL